MCIAIILIICFFIHHRHLWRMGLIFIHLVSRKDKECQMFCGQSMVHKKLSGFFLPQISDFHFFRSQHFSLPGLCFQRFCSASFAIFWSPFWNGLCGDLQKDRTTASSLEPVNLNLEGDYFEVRPSYIYWCGIKKKAFLKRPHPTILKNYHGLYSKGCLMSCYSYWAVCMENSLTLYYVSSLRTTIIFCGGNIQRYSVLTPDSVLRDYSWWCSREHMWCQGSSLCQFRAR